MHQSWALFLLGASLQLSLAGFVPLQALVTHCVPVSRVGEAMGAVASAKSLCSVLAPILAGAASQALIAAGHTDLQWIFFPVGSLLLMFAWPLVFLLRSRLSIDTDSEWSTWASKPHRLSQLTVFSQGRQTTESMTGARIENSHSVSGRPTEENAEDDFHDHTAGSLKHACISSNHGVAHPTVTIDAA